MNLLREISGERLPNRSTMHYKLGLKKNGYPLAEREKCVLSGRDNHRVCEGSLKQPAGLTREKQRP